MFQSSMSIHPNRSTGNVKKAIPSEKRSMLYLEENANAFIVPEGMCIQERMIC